MFQTAVQFGDDIVEASVGGRVFVAGTALTSISLSTEIPLLLLKNPSGSGKYMRIFRGVFGIDSTQARAIFRLYKSPTITANGTPLPITNQLQSATAPASAMLAFQLPTISNNGTPFSIRIVPANQPTHALDLPHLYSVDENENILVTVTNLLINQSAHAAALWIEEPKS